MKDFKDNNQNNQNNQNGMDEDNKDQKTIDQSAAEVIDMIGQINIKPSRSSIIDRIVNTVLCIISTIALISYLMKQSHLPFNPDNLETMRLLISCVGFYGITIVALQMIQTRRLLDRIESLAYEMLMIPAGTVKALLDLFDIDYEDMGQINQMADMENTEGEEPIEPDDADDADFSHYPECNNCSGCNGCNCGLNESSEGINNTDNKDNTDSIEKGSEKDMG